MSRRSRFRALLGEWLEPRTPLAVDLSFALDLTRSNDARTDLVATDAVGYAYVASRFQGTVEARNAALSSEAPTATFVSQGGYDLLVAKYSPDGDLVWARQFGSTVSEAPLAGLAADAAGHVYLAGEFSGTLTGDDLSLTSSGGTDGFLVRLDEAGRTVWSASFGATGDDRATALAISPTGLLIVAGSFTGKVDFAPGAPTVTATSESNSSSAFLATLSTAGELRWVRTLGGGANLIAIQDLDVTALEQIVVGGIFTGSPDFDPGTAVATATSRGAADVFVARYDSQGAMLWTKTFGVAGADNFGGVALSVNGTVYVGGALTGTGALSWTTSGGVTTTLAAPGAAATDAYVAEFDLQGNFLRAIQFGRSAGTTVKQIASDSSGAVYVTGQFTGLADFDPRELARTQVALGSSDLFVAKYLPYTLDLAWSGSVGGTSTETAGGLALDSAGDVLLAGTYVGDADLDLSIGAATFTAAGSRNGFFTKSAQAATGLAASLRTDFANQGRLLTDLPAQFPTKDLAYATVMQGTKFLAAGTSDNQIAVVRYLASGAVDTTFGTAGVGRLSWGADQPIFGGTLVQSSGKIVVYGMNRARIQIPGSSAIDDTIVVARFTADGQLDTTFGEGGKRSIPIRIGGQTFSSQVFAGTLQNDQKIVLGGHSAAGFGTLLVIRLTADGALDSTFNGGGLWANHQGPSSAANYVTAIAMQGTSILLGGQVSWTVTGGSGSGPFLARLMPAGELDTTFSPTGFRTFGGVGALPGGSGYSVGVKELSVAADNSIVAAVTFGQVDPWTLAGVYSTFFNKFSASGVQVSSYGIQGSAFLTGEIQSLSRASDGGLFVKLQHVKPTLVYVPEDSASHYEVVTTYSVAKLDSQGKLDLTYGTKGYAPVGGFGDAMWQAGGTVLIAGVEKGDFQITRLTTRGVLDSSFHATGVVVTPLEQRTLGHNFAWAAAYDGKGRLVLAGQVDKDGVGAQMIVTRYLASGELDVTFGSAGSTYVASNAAAYSLAILPDNSIVVGGSRGNLASLDKLKSDGSLDTSFTATRAGFGFSLAAFSDLAVDASGRIVASGYGELSGVVGLIVARFKADGKLDTQFSSDGYDVQKATGVEQYGNSIAVAPDGKIVVGGAIYNGSSSKHDFAVWRYKTDGTLDKSGFNGNGLVTINFGGEEYVYGVGVLPNGQIVAAGTTTKSTDGGDIALALVNVDGKLSTSFGNAGKAIDSTGLQDNVGGMALTADGRIVVGGWTTAGYEVVRYLPNGNGDLTFGNQGRIIVPTKDPPTAFGDVAIGADGRIAAVGTTAYHLTGSDFNFNYETIELTGDYDPLTITLSGARIDENSPIGTLVGTLDTTLEQPGFSPTYTLLNGGARFRLNGARLELSGTTPLDYESGSAFLVRVQTKDAAGANYYSTFTIQTADVNEAPTALFLSRNTVSEGLPVGSQVGRLSTIDPDAGESFSYSLATGAGDTDNAWFTISPTGQLLTAAVFDFETRTNYSVRIRVTDRGGLSYEQAFAITVTFVDSVPPTVASTTSTSGGGAIYAGAQYFDVHFSETVQFADQAGRYSLVGAGPDGWLGTGDDVSIAATVTASGDRATLDVAPLTAGIYRLVVQGTIRDTWANLLDGDHDGAAGGDYREDFVVTSRGTSDLELAVSRTLGPGGAPLDVTQGDWNEDGRADLAVPAPDVNGVRLLFGNGAGGFTGSNVVATGGVAPRAIVSGFLNGDLYADLAIAHATDGAVTVLLGDGSGGFVLSSATPWGKVGAILADLALDDFDANGTADLATIDTSGNLYVLLGDGHGGFTQRGAAIGTGVAGSRRLAAARLGADDEVDLVVVDASAATVGSYRGDGAGGFTLVGAAVSTGGADARAFALGDLDGDGRLDLAVANAGSNSVAVLVADAAGAFQLVGSPWAVGFGPGALAIGDVDRDSFPDLLIGDSATGALTAWLGDGAARFSPGPTMTLAGAPTELLVGEFDGPASGKEFVALEGAVGRVETIEATDVAARRRLVAGGPASGVWEFAVATSGAGFGQLVSFESNATSPGALEGTLRLRVAGVDVATPGQTSTIDDAGRTVVTASASVGGLIVSRDVFVPNRDDLALARTIDTFTNPTAGPLTVPVIYLGNLGADGATHVVTTSSGDATVTAADQWLLTDDQDGAGTPAVLHFVHGRAGLAPTTTELSGDNVRWTYSLTVPAGQSVRLASFTVLATTRAAAVQAVDSIVGPTRLAAPARENLTAEEESLANFLLNVAPADLLLDYAAVAENQPAGTIVGELSTVDPDPVNTFTYALATGVGDEDNERFTVSSNGTLRTGRSFDFEARSTYQVRVRTTDQGGLWFERAFTITIDDLAEPPSDAEPNDSRATALPLTSAVPAYGRIGNGAAGTNDVDYFRFTLAPDQMASFGGYGFGGQNVTNFTTLRLYDEAGNDLSDYLSYWGTFYQAAGGTFYAAINGPLASYTLNYSARTLPVLGEIEPNDVPAQAQPISLAVGAATTRTGFIGDRTVAGDPDLYSVFVPAGSVLTVSIDALAGFPSSGSSLLEALDDAGQVIGTNPAFYLPLEHYEFVGRTITVRFSERADLKQAYSITFAIETIDSARLDAEPNDTLATARSSTADVPVQGFLGNGASTPDVDMVRFALAPGQMASFVGYGAGGYNSLNFTTLKLYDEAGTDLSSSLSYWGTFYSATGGTFVAAITGPVEAYTFRYNVQTIAGLTEIEPNDDATTAQSVAVAPGGSANVAGYVGDRTPAGDADFYSIFVPSGQVLTASIESVPGAPSSGSWLLEAFDAQGVLLDVNPAYYLPLTHYEFVGRTITVRFSERADLKQAYKIVFQLDPIDAGLLDAEPNDDRATAAPLAPGVAWHGYLGNNVSGVNDVDRVRVTMAPGQLASFPGYGYGGYNAANFTTLKLYDATGADVSGYLSYWGTFYSATGGEFTAAVTGPRGTYSFRYTLQTIAGLTEVEPNDALVDAQRIALSVGSTATRTGFLGDRTAAGDADYFAVDVPAHARLEVSVRAWSDSTPFSGGGLLQALNGGERLLASNLTSMSPLIYFADAGGTVYVRYSERSDLKHAYGIDFALTSTGEGIGEPRIDAIEDRTIDEDSRFAVTFGVQDDETPGNVQVTFASSDEMLLPGANLELVRDGDVWTLRGAPVADRSGTAVVTLTATDSDGQSSHGRFALHVLPTNDPPTDVELTGATTPENSLGAAIGALSTIDVDGTNGTTYELLFDPAEAFVIVGNQLRLRANAAADYESAASYYLVVRATDAGGATFDQDFTIDVNDVNEPPADIQLDSTDVLEKLRGASVGIVTALDPDFGDSTTWSVDDPRFEIVADRLSLRDGEWIRRSSETTVTVTLIATDLAAPPHSFSKLFVLTVVANPSPWRNPDRPLDVNGDTFVAPVDALLIINELNTAGARALTPPREGEPRTRLWIDTNGDDFVAPNDALLVINELNARAGAEGESGGGEGSGFLMVVATAGAGESSRILSLPNADFAKPSMPKTDRLNASLIDAVVAESDLDWLPRKSSRTRAPRDAVDRTYEISSTW